MSFPQILAALLTPNTEQSPANKHNQEQSIIHVV